MKSILPLLTTPLLTPLFAVALLAGAVMAVEPAPEGFTPLFDGWT